MFMADATDVDVGMRKLVGAPSAHRVPNQEYIKSYEHALTGGLGLTFQHFKPASPVAPLLPEESRYFVDHQSTGSQFKFPDDDPPGRLRSCIHNSVTGTNRLELPLSAKGGKLLPRQALHTVVDKGAVGFPGCCWLYWKQKVRGCLFSDFWHQDWNGLQAAALEAGVWNVCLERAIVLNMPHGPWQGDAFFGVMKAGSASFFESHDHTNELFSFMMDRICQESGDFSLDYGSPEHVQRVWADLKGCKSLRSKGKKVRMGRWYSLFHEAGDRLGEDSKLLMILVYIGMRDGFWTSIWDSPMCKRARPQAPPSASPQQHQHMHQQDPSASSSSNTRPQTVKASNAQVDAMRKGARNTLELCVKILANTLNCRLFHAVFYAQLPCMSSFSQWETLIRTQVGVLEFHLEQAGGVNDGIASAMLLRIRGGPNFHHLGFWDPARATLGPSSTMEEDLIVAAKLYRFTVALVGQRLMLSMWYSHNLPGMLVLLLSPNPDVVKSCLGKLALIWKYLCEAEQLGHTDTFVAGSLKQIMWPGFVWVREQLIVLAECRFEGVPTEVKQSLTSLFRGWLTTKPIEDAMNVLTARMESNPMKKCQSKTRWHSLVTSSLVKDYDCKPPPVTQAVKQVALTALPASIFSATCADFSLGMDELKTISSDTTWPSPNAASWNQASYFMACLLEVCGDWGCVKTSWLSLLVEPGVILMNSTKPYCPVVVISVSKWGCLVWPVQGHVHAGRKWMSFTPASEASPRPWSFKVISSTTLSSIRAYPVKVSRPDTPLRNASGEWVGDGVLFNVEDAQGGLQLPVLAAMRAFMPLTVQNMADLASILEVPLPSPRPATEKAWSAFLVNHYLPSLSQAERDAIICQRGSRQTKQQETVLEHEENLGAVEGVVDDGDLPKFEAVSKAKQPASAKSTATRAAGAPSAATAASSSGPGLAPATFSPIPGVKSVTPEWAKRYLPSATGCSLVLDERRHNRWMVQYKHKADPPYSHSKAFGTQSNVTSRTALMTCLRWAWQVHSDETGQPCPWTLE